MYTGIESKIWSDSKFKSLQNDDKLFYFYLLTCRHRNILGLYNLPVLYAAADLNLPEKNIQKSIQNLIEKGIILYDFENEIILIKNFLKYHELMNPNMVKKAITKLDELNDTELFLEFSLIIEGLDKPLYKPLLERLGKRLPIPLPIPLPNGYAQQEKEKEKGKEKGQVKEYYCSEPKSEKPALSDQEPEVAPHKRINFDFQKQQWTGIIKSDIDNWNKIFSAVNLDYELEKIKLWLMANPTKKKKNYFRFISNWLARTQEKGGTPNYKPPLNQIKTTDDIKKQAQEYKENKSSENKKMILTVNQFWQNNKKRFTFQELKEFIKTVRQDIIYKTVAKNRDARKFLIKSKFYELYKNAAKEIRK